MKNYDTVKVLGLNFFKGSANQVVDSLKSGGLLVVPAAPALISILNDKRYYQSLLNADIIIPDSGYMTLVWNVLSKNKLTRISGLKFLTEFINDEEIRRSQDIFLVDPRQNEANANLDYLRSIRFNLPDKSSYVAPLYERANVVDLVLLNTIEKIKPKYIIINLGGGVQEKLGAYLKENLSYSPAIICTGAAIAFLTGLQAKIPNWADKVYLGWLFRCMKNPNLYVPRYFKAFKLFSMMLKFGEKAPS